MSWAITHSTNSAGWSRTDTVAVSASPAHDGGGQSATNDMIVSKASPICTANSCT